MASEITNEVRLKRPRGFYISDNELVDELAAEIGIFAFGVYHLLLRKAEGRAGARLSQRDIVRCLAISKDSAANAIATLKNARLVEEQPSEQPDGAPTYLIVFAKDVVAGRKGRPEFRTRVKTKRVLKSGQAVGEIQDRVALISGHHCPEIRTPNIEANQTKPLELNTTPLPPSQARGDLPSRPDVPRGGNGEDLHLVAGELVRMDPGVVMGPEFLESSMRQRLAGITPAARLEAQLVMATARVARECGIVTKLNPRPSDVSEVIHQALELHCGKTHATPEQAAELAIANVKAYQRDRNLLAHGWGWRKFFGEGHWVTPEAWPVDQGAIRRLRVRQNARVGMATRDERRPYVRG